MSQVLDDELFEHNARTRASPKRNAEARCPSTLMGRPPGSNGVFANRAIGRYGLDVPKAQVGLKTNLPQSRQVLFLGGETHPRPIMAGGVRIATFYELPGRVIDVKQD